MRHQYYELSSDSLDLCKGKLTPGIAATWGEIAGNIETQKDLVSYISAHGTADWGSISGSITDQTDLIEYTDRFATTAWVQEQGYLTSASLSGYATESWVSSQGYIKTETEYYSSGKLYSMQLTASSIYIQSFFLSAGRYIREGHVYIEPGRIITVDDTPGGNLTAIHGLYASSYMGIAAMFSGWVESVYSGWTEIGMSIDNSSDLMYGIPYMYISDISASANFYADHITFNGGELNYADILSTSDLSQYATRQWVTGRGYITSSSLSGYIHFDESSPLSSIGKTLPFYSSTVGLFPVYQSYSSTWVNIEMTTNPVGWVSMALACYTEDGSSEIWRDKFITENDMTGYVSRSYVDWRLVQEEGYPLSIYTPADENGNYTIGSLDDTTHAFTGIKVSGSQVGAYTVISSGLQYQESFDPFVTQSWITSQNYLQESSTAIQSITSRLSALETNYGDALSITNNILS